MEKDPESMAVNLKQDYAASEVYSTTSEAPPVSVLCDHLLSMQALFLVTWTKKSQVKIMD